MENSERNSGLMFRLRAGSALFMLASGFGMSVAGFAVSPVGVIDDSVLLYTAQALVYAGTALGIDLMVDCKIKNLKR